MTDWLSGENGLTVFPGLMVRDFKNSPPKRAWPFLHLGATGNFDLEASK